MSETERANDARSERQPDLELRFFFSAHATAEDFRAIQEQLQQADVYIPEATGWDNSVRDRYKAVAEGTVHRTWGDNVNSNPLALQYDYLYRSNKVILLLDIPQGNPALQDMVHAGALQQRASDYFFKGNLSRAIEKKRAAAQADAKFQRAREQYIVQGLRRDIPKLRDNFPQLREKSKLRVLASLGSAHTGVFHAMREQEPTLDIIRDMSADTTVFTRYSQVIREMVLTGKEAPHDDEFYARMFIEDAVRTSVLKGGVTQDSLKAYWLARHLADTVSYEQIEQISDQTKVSGRDVNAMRNAMESAGVHIPTTESDIDNLLT